MCKCTCVYITHIYAKENNSNLKNSIISTKCPKKRWPVPQTLSRLKFQWNSYLRNFKIYFTRYAIKIKCFGNLSKEMWSDCDTYFLFSNFNIYKRKMENNEFFIYKIFYSLINYRIKKQQF